MGTMNTAEIAGGIVETINKFDRLMDLKKEAWQFRLSNNPNNSYHGREDSPVVLVFNLIDDQTASRVASQVNESLEHGVNVEGEGPFLTCFYKQQEGIGR